MTQKEWFDRCTTRGSTGDMIFDVIADWKQSQKDYEDYFCHCLIATIEIKMLERVLKYYNENKKNMSDILKKLRS